MSVTDNSREGRFQFLAEMTQNPSAAAMLVEIGDMIRLADNIADGDSDDPQEDMARVLHFALCTIPDSVFFDENRHTLRPLLGSMVASWQISNRFHRRDDPNALTFGFVLREAGERLTMEVIALCVGWENAADAYERIFDFVPHHRTETLADWVEERRG